MATTSRASTTMNALWAFLPAFLLFGCGAPFAVVRYHDLGSCIDVVGNVVKQPPNSAYTLIGVDSIANRSKSPVTFTPTRVALLATSQPVSYLMPSNSAVVQSVLGSEHLVAQTTVPAGQTISFPDGALGMFQLGTENTGLAAGPEANQYWRPLLYEPVDSTKILMVKDNLARRVWPSLRCADVDTQLTTYIYVAIDDQKGGKIETYSIDASDGKVKQAAPPLAKVTSFAPTGIGVTATMDRVWVNVKNDANDSPEIYARSLKTGALITGSQVPKQEELAYLSATQPPFAFGPSGNAMYVVIRPEAGIYNVDSYRLLSGTPSMSTSDASLQGPHVPLTTLLSADPSGQFIYETVVLASNGGGIWANWSLGWLYAYPIIQTFPPPAGLLPGELSGAAYSSHGGPLSSPHGVLLVATAGGAFVGTSQGLFAYRVKDQKILLLGSAPLDETPQSLATDPSGAYVYVSLPSGIRTYAIDVISGVPKLASQVADSSPSRQIATDPFGRFVIALNPEAAVLTSYAIDPDTGALTNVSSTSTGTKPVAFAVSGTLR